RKRSWDSRILARLGVFAYGTRRLLPSQSDATQPRRVQPGGALCRWGGPRIISEKARVHKIVNNIQLDSVGRPNYKHNASEVCNDLRILFDLELISPGISHAERERRDPAR